MVEVRRFRHLIPGADHERFGPEMVEMPAEDWDAKCDEARRLREQVEMLLALHHNVMRQWRAYVDRATEDYESLANEAVRLGVKLGEPRERHPAARTGPPADGKE